MNGDSELHAGTSGGRASKARSWILVAFSRLVLGKRYEDVGVGEISRRAGVGRSTFYEHFRDKDEVLRRSLEPVLTPLADAAVGAGDSGRVRWVVEHVATNRVRAAGMLEGPARLEVERALAELIEERLVRSAAAMEPGERRLRAAMLAGSRIAALRSWLREGGRGNSSAVVTGLMMEAGGTLER